MLFPLKFSFGRLPSGIQAGRPRHFPSGAAMCCREYRNTSEADRREWKAAAAATEELSVGPSSSQLWGNEVGKFVERKGGETMVGTGTNIQGAIIELKDAASFQVASEEGLISICGFGSLLSERSARLTFPKLLNFRVGVLHGFRRVFAHVAPVFLERGIANVETKEMSSLSVEVFPTESIIVTVFEISHEEVPAFIEREHEFRFLAVTVHTLEGEISAQKAVICARYSDEEYRRDRCQGDEEYHNRYGRFDIQHIWRDDILPCRTYLRHCVLAAQTLSQAAYDSFLDHTFLGDRVTTIRQHLAADDRIMQEEPPLLCDSAMGAKQCMMIHMVSSEDKQRGVEPVKRV